MTALNPFAVFAAMLGFVDVHSRAMSEVEMVCCSGGCGGGCGGGGGVMCAALLMTAFPLRLACGTVLLAIAPMVLIPRTVIMWIAGGTHH